MSDSSPETPPTLMVQAQIVVTLGFDAEGDMSTWVESTASSLVEALGMMEVAKHFILQQYDSSHT